MTEPRTLFAKLWDAHVVCEAADGRALLFIDRHLIHDGSFHSFNRLREKGLPVANPGLCLATPDHYAPTTSRSADTVDDPAIRRVLNEFDINVNEFAVPVLALADPRQGIVHVIGPEQGFTLPGTTLVCGDSHTSTHGALGALAFGIGASEVAHVLATQCTWQKRPQTMCIRIDGLLPPGVYAKDLALTIIATIGTAGAVGCVVEYSGSTVSALSIEERCTLCNMTIEAGARAGLIAPDETTFAYLRNKPLAPKQELWHRAVEYWRTLKTDDDAHFDRTVSVQANSLQPMVTWGTSPEQAIPLSGRVPHPGEATSDEEANGMLHAMQYMGLVAGQPIATVDIDQVFIGSCANSRLEDLRVAAEVIQGIGGKVKLPTLVSPGSTQVKLKAEAEGIADIFIAAGVQWHESGCSMCVGMNGDRLGPGKRCISTSNRNFAGRQGRDSRTHLVSPATAAATAMLGHLAAPPAAKGAG